MLTFRFKGSDGEEEIVLPILAGMHRYEMQPSDGCGEIVSLQIVPNAPNCMVSVRKIGFER